LCEASAKAQVMLHYVKRHLPRVPSAVLDDLIADES
jgi:hypothetical protein